MSAGSVFPTPILDDAGSWSATRPCDVYDAVEIAELSKIKQEERRPDSIGRLFELLDESGEDDYGEVAPSQYAFKSAYLLIAKAERVMAMQVVGSPCVDSVGGIRVAWKRQDRQVRLICPASSSEHAYIYKQAGDTQETIHAPTSDTLANTLTWLTRGVDSL